MRIEFSNKNSNYLFLFRRNGNFKGNNFKSNKGFSSKNNNNDDDGYYSDYRKKRQYGLNVDQDTSYSTMNQQRVLPKGFPLGYNPVQTSSYGSINPQTRLLATNSFPQQSELPTQPISQPLLQRMLFSNT